MAKPLAPHSAPRSFMQLNPLPVRDTHSQMASTRSIFAITNHTVHSIQSESKRPLLRYPHRHLDPEDYYSPSFKKISSLYSGSKTKSSFSGWFGLTTTASLSATMIFGQILSVWWRSERQVPAQGRSHRGLVCRPAPWWRRGVRQLASGLICRNLRRIEYDHDCI